jgi:hypothetical protein
MASHSSATASRRSTPGGYTLSEIGISLSVRGVVIDVNHCNTAEIVAFANAVVAGDEYTDIEGCGQLRDGVDTVTRNGPAPVLSRHRSWPDHDAALVARVREVIRLFGTSWGDVGVLATANWQVAKTKEALVAAGSPAIDLDRYDGRPVDAVKVARSSAPKASSSSRCCSPESSPPCSTRARSRPRSQTASAATSTAVSSTWP